MTTTANFVTTTLKNGLIVGNFSSPHQFNFEDGSILERVDAEDSKRLSLKAIEKESIRLVRNVEVCDLDLSFELDDACRERANEWIAVWEAREVDVVIVPFPFLEAFKRNRPELVGSEVPSHPFRTIRTADRETKAAHCDRFCV